MENLAMFVIDQKSVVPNEDSPGMELDLHTRLCNSLPSGPEPLLSGIQFQLGHERTTHCSLFSFQVSHIPSLLLQDLISL